MICENCKKQPASVHYTEIVNSEMVSMHLCRECADEKGFEVASEAPPGLGDLVAGLIDTAASDESERIGRVQCPACGYDYSQFKQMGRLGCPECYGAFEAQLVPVLRHVHGSAHHRGKVPPVMHEQAAQRAQIEALTRELDRAVEAEEYERAASLRDEIRDIHGHEAEAEGKSDE